MIGSQRLPPRKEQQNGPRGKMRCVMENSFNFSRTEPSEQIRHTIDLGRI